MFGDDSDEEALASSSTRVCQILQRPANSGVGEFHEGTEAALMVFVESTVPKYDPVALIDAIDSFCYSRHWMMNVGDIKGVDLDKAVQLAIDNARAAGTPCIVVELGSYCGYSAVRIGHKLSQQYNDLVISIDNESKCIDFTRRMIQHSGVESKVKLIHAPAGKSIGEVKELISERLKMENSSLSIDDLMIHMLLVDHEKSLYYKDLIVFEESGLLKTGSIVVSDNVLSFGQPKQDLLDHVRNSGKYSSSTLYTSALEYTAEGILFGASNSNYNNTYIGNLNDTDKQLLTPLLAKSEVDGVDGVEVSIYK